MIVLSYFGILALIPLLVEKEDKEVQWHAKHGLVLAAIEFAAVIVLMIVGVVVANILGPLSCLLGLLWIALAIGVLIVHILCIVKGVIGERFLIPGVSEFADRF